MGKKKVKKKSPWWEDKHHGGIVSKNFLKWEFYCEY